MANVVNDASHLVRFAQVSCVHRPKNKILVVHVMTVAGLQAVQWEFDSGAECQSFYDALIAAMNA
jgi:hypothetical protein